MKHLNMSTSYACSHVFLGISGALEWPDGSKCGQRKRRQDFCKMLFPNKGKIILKTLSEEKAQ